MEGCKDGNCQEGPDKRREGAGLHGPLQVYTVLHPPGPDVCAAQCEEERRNGPLSIGASFYGCFHLHMDCVDCYGSVPVTWLQEHHYAIVDHSADAGILVQSKVPPKAIPPPLRPLQHYRGQRSACFPWVLHWGLYGLIKLSIAA